MNVKQKFSILVLPKWKKTDSQGMTPIYLRITIDGLEDELSVGCKVQKQYWDPEAKQATPDTPGWTGINKKINDTVTDVDYHFKLMQVKNGLVTPSMVKKSYLTPICGQQIRTDRHKNIELDVALDLLIEKYLKHCKKVKKASAEGKTPTPAKQQLFDQEKLLLEKDMKSLVQQANLIFDAQDHQKTFLLTLNEYLLDFLQLAFSDNRSPNTLEKWMGRKNKFKHFLEYRYKVEDMALEQIQYSFINEVYKYFLVEHRVIPNTATKYAQCIKDLMNRAVARKWISANIFVTYKCHYEDTDKGWPTMQEIEELIQRPFQNEKLNELRDIFIFQCFTGYSYAEVRRLGPNHNIRGIDGKVWTSIKRQKTKGDETLPLLPVALDILEKYQVHPICVRRNTYLPVPSCEDYNRGLKVIGELCNIAVVLTTHTGRYFFANEIAYNNGAQLKTVARLLGQKSIASAAKYVKANRKHISDTMAGIEEILFTKEGKLKPSLAGPNRYLNHSMSRPGEARIVQMRVV